MRIDTRIILFAFILPALGQEEESMNHSANAELEDSTDNNHVELLVDKLINKLVDKLITSWPLQHGDRDETALVSTHPGLNRVTAHSTPSFRAPQFQQQFPGHRSQFPSPTLPCRQGHICHAEETKRKRTKSFKEAEEELKARGGGGDFWQLLKMGAGTFSGDLKEINLKDPERSVVFELEANNFETKDGKPITLGNEPGYVDTSGGNTSALNFLIPIILFGGAVALVAATFTNPQFAEGLGLK